MSHRPIGIPERLDAYMVQDGWYDISDESGFGIVEELDGEVAKEIARRYNTFPLMLKALLIQIDCHTMGHGDLVKKYGNDYMGLRISNARLAINLATEY